MTPTMNRFVAPSSDELEQFARNQVGFGFFLVKGLKKERVLGGSEPGGALVRVFGGSEPGNALVKGCAKLKI